MKKSFKVTLLVLLILGVGALTAYYIMTHDFIVLNPKGHIGHREKDLIITSSLLMLIVIIPVLILTLFFSWRYREGRNSRHEPDWEHNYIAEYCWWGVPVVIVSILAVITWKSTHLLNPFKPLESDKKALEIQVVALQWKWLFIYPEQGIATLNYVQFPEQTPINFEITADAPMNSFWIPQLGGQIYAMPGKRSKLHLISDKVGIFAGKSSNFSGKGFAGMSFKAEATTEQDFNNWVGQVRGSPNRLGFKIYENLVKPSENEPVTYYNLTDRDLFEQVLDKYLVPPKEQ